MNGLMLDTPSSGIVTPEQAFSVALPGETRTYKPVPNEELWNMLNETAQSRGLQLGIPQMGLASKGQRLFAMFRDFQIHLEAFRKEQEEINHKLQRLVDRGEFLSLEDLRQLEATKAQQQRKVDRELRREEVGRMLSHFRQQRQEGRRVDAAAQLRSL